MNTKRYRLKKDLPTFCAGDKFILAENGNLRLYEFSDGRRLSPGITAYTAQTLKEFPNILKDWFEETGESYGWEPIFGECYHYLDVAGEVRDTLWDATTTDRDMLSVGNFFHTEEEAKAASEWLKARKVLFDDTKGFKPDWKNDNQVKWLVSARREVSQSTAKFLTMKLFAYCVAPGPYFRTKRDANNSIANHRREWLTYLGVEEDKEEVKP